MLTIALTNEKGGVGKTTMSVHLAAGLAIRGLRVVILDADPQANTTQMLGFDAASSFYDLLVRDASFNEVLLRVPHEAYQAPGQDVKGDLLLVRSNVETRNIAGLLRTANTVRDRVKDLKGWADVVLFDMSPTPSSLHANIYIASDAVICPTTCDQLSLSGLQSSISRINKVARVIGIIPTIYRPKTALHRYNLSVLQEVYGKLVWPPIPQRISWSEASQMRQTIFAYEPNGEAAREMWKLIDIVEYYHGQSEKVRGRTE